jgi:pantoate--beta-alanine ligase
VSETALSRTTRELRKTMREWRDRGLSVALVPTMGNLHDGHLSLAALARQSADCVVMSIYVNPTQFVAGEDFGAYPRTLEQDRATVERDGCVDHLFVPNESAIYPFGTDDAVRVSMPGLSRELCGASRPGHFDGVASVVLRLLNIVAPDVLVLGRKDYQQLILIERMIADLSLDVRVTSGPTMRHDDGLAFSSRNRYLTDDERKRAPALHDVLVDLAEAAGGTDYASLQQAAVADLQARGFEPDYVEVRRAGDLAVPDGTETAAELIVLAAAWLGKARLIDNLAFGELAGDVRVTAP